MIVITTCIVPSVKQDPLFAMYLVYEYVNNNKGILIQYLLSSRTRHLQYVLRNCCPH